MSFWSANYNITKLKKNGMGEIEYLELNGQEVPIKTVNLYAWKYSSSYIYTKELFKSDTENVTTYGGNPIAKATTGDYVAAHINYVWKIGSTFYTDEMTSTTAPAGTAGSAKTIAEVYIATSEDTDLTEGTWYTSTGTGANIKYYEVDGLVTDGVTLGDEITDGEAKAALAAASFSDLKCVPYAEGEKIVYDSHDYYRYSDKDITL